MVVGAIFPNFIFRNDEKNFIEKKPSSAKKSSPVSGNWPGGSFFITHPPAYSNVYQNIYFNFQKTRQKKQNKQKKKREYLWKI